MTLPNEDVKLTELFLGTASSSLSNHKETVEKNLVFLTQKWSKRNLQLTKHYDDFRYRTHLTALALENQEIYLDQHPEVCEKLNLTKEQILRIVRVAVMNSKRSDFINDIPVFSQFFPLEAFDATKESKASPSLMEYYFGIEQTYEQVKETAKVDYSDPSPIVENGEYSSFGNVNLSLYKKRFDLRWNILPIVLAKFKELVFSQKDDAFEDMQNMLIRSFADEIAKHRDLSTLKLLRICALGNNVVEYGSKIAENDAYRFLRAWGDENGKLYNEQRRGTLNRICGTTKTINSILNAEFPVYQSLRGIQTAYRWKESIEAKTGVLHMGTLNEDIEFYAVHPGLFIQDNELLMWYKSKNEEDIAFAASGTEVLIGLDEMTGEQLSSKEDTQILNSSFARLVKFI